jgi:RHS repeat-associated protein
MKTSFKNKFLLLAVLLLVYTIGFSQNINKPNKMGPMGTEVNTSSGNLYIPRTDVYIPARGFDINLSFYYNSFFYDTTTGFGKGWSSSYSIQYKNDTANGKIIFWGDGREDAYKFSGGNFISPKGFFNTLTQYQPNKYLLTELDGTKFYFDNVIHRKITKLEEPNGNFINFMYTDSLLTTITNTAGQSITLSYNNNGNLTSIIDAITAPTRTHSYTYDTYGNLTKVTDPLGGFNKYSYLVNGPMKTMSDKNNNTIDIIYYNDYTTREIIGCNKRQSFAYDTATNITMVTDYLANGINQITKYEYQKQNDAVWLKKLSGNCCGFNMQFEFDTDGNKIKETDANGNTTQFTYDSRGNVLTVKDALNQTMSYSYNAAFNTLQSYTDHKGNVYSFTYDAKGNLTQLTEPGNLTYTATYNTNGDILSSTDAKGNVYQYNYDSYGNPTTVTGPNGYTAILSVDARGNLLSYKDARNNTTTLQYDILNRLKKIIDPINQSIDVNYDAEDNLTSIQNQNNETTAFSYDASNRIVKVNDALGNKTFVGYDAMNNVTAIQNALGNNTTFSYDNLNRISGGKDAAGNVFTIDYDNNGNMLALKLPNELIKNFTYDKLNRVVIAKDDIGNNASVQYDANGNITQITNPTGATTNASYDNLNRIKSITDPLGNTTQLNYDNNGLVSSMTDRNGNTSTYTYDSTDRVKTYTDAIGGIVTINYDAQGNIASLKDQNNNITLYTYDSLNRNKGMIYPDGKFIEYSYDKKSNIVSKKLADGTSINFQYDSINRPIVKTLPGGHTYTYTYDAIGRIKTATNNSGIVTFAYDNLDRLISENFDNKTTRYNYDIPNRTQTTIYPDSTIVLKTFDKRNNLIAVAKNGQSIVTIAYNNANQIITKTFANGVLTNYQYDVANRLTNITSGAFQNTGFTYDKVGNKKTIVRNNDLTKSEEFNYDSAYRMIGYKKGIIGGTPTVNNTYTYDLLGNRTTASLNGVATTYGSNSLNQMTNLNNGSQNINFTYDNNGNQTYNGSFYKKYDAEGRLVMDSAAPSNKITYQYDAFGRRTKKSTLINSFKYGYSGLSQIELRDGNTDTILTKTIFSNFLMPIQNEKVNKNYYYHQNELASVENISSTSGNNIENYSYDPYGKASITDSAGNTIANAATGNRFGFTGQELDGETNDYHFYFRNYNTTTGTFYQRDLIGYADGMGMYQYVGNNPANGIDILGLETDPCAEKTSGSNPWFDFGNNYSKFSDAIGYLSSLTGIVTDIAPGVALETNNVMSYVALSKLAGFVSPVTNRIGALSLATSTIDYGKGFFGAENRSVGKHMDGIGGIVSAGVGLFAKAPQWKAVAGSYGLLNSEIKYITKGNYGGFADFMQGQYKDMFNNLAGNSKFKEELLDIESWKQYENNPELLSNYFRTRERMKERENAFKAKNKIPKCPQNGPTGGTQKPTTKSGNQPGGSKGEGISSHDPNEIIGPTGQPSKAWVSVNDRLPYTITFENAKTAGAPAKYVKVITPIEPKQDPATFQLGSFAFNNLTFNVPTNAPSYYNRLDCRDSLGLYVDITAGYDVVKNEAFWEFQSIDPVTLLPPTSPMVGFLLLQDSTKPASGHGFVNFSIKPKTNAITLDTIVAKAKIVFDSNDTIPTNLHKNTIDAFAPTSHMNTLPATSPNPVQLSWTGTDDVGGCGVKSYTLYVSTNGVSFYILKSGITRTDTTIRLAQDSSYCFFVLATDSVGNMEALRPGEIKCTTISGGVLPVTWLYFRGTNKDKDNVLEWATTNEQNSKNFILERSLNAVNFSSIATIAAQGNSTSQQNYDYKDVGIDKLNSAVFYYRLKQFDLNGSFKTSNIVRLNYNQKGIINSIVYPNPTQGMITVTVGDRALVGTQALVYDVNGRLLQQVKITAQSQSFNFSSLTNGTYFIRLENKKVMKIIKQ